MSSYDFRAIENKWQARWKEQSQFVADVRSPKPKYYILDMFPYPSGAGLHVGHPLGYIATGVLAQYKRMSGFNVLRPMGFDSFGLPAENYAIQKGVHPQITTEQNIARYKSQLERLGLGYDPSTEVWTSQPSYYKWTQWIFIQLFKSWYNKTADKAEPIETLVSLFEKGGSAAAEAAHSSEAVFTAEEWRAFEEKRKQEILLDYRLAYQSYTYVNWCEALGTVLANEEVKDGLSERGGHPVERRLMRQWSLRITAYAERLLQGLGQVEWPASLVEMQKNWIGKSQGARISFQTTEGESIEVFSTRPDTIFGATFMVVAPEHPVVEKITAPEQQTEVEQYLEYAKSRSERDRMAEAKEHTGVFTGAYAVHPFNKEKIPVWISDYVLYGYGTGAVMAVPAHDSRDYAFAKQFGLEIVEVVSGGDISEAAFEAKNGKLVNSDFLNGLEVKEAVEKAIERLENEGLGARETNYRLRDAIFSRQRYWGEPIPIIHRDGVPRPVDESELPVTLPEVESYKQTGSGESPLAAIQEWVEQPDGGKRETNTMPGWAGSSWYFFRYIDPENDKCFVAEDLAEKWTPVDLYVGGAEHAVGHLLYARFWTKFLYDRGFAPVEEPFRRLVNQGMIQGVSKIVYKRKDANVFDSLPPAKSRKGYIPIHADVNLVDENDCLDIEGFKAWMPEYKVAAFNPDENGCFKCKSEVEKMSKSLHNVVNPDDICDEYGADTFRLYEMFLGPLEQSKPWNTQGITGSFNFLRKVWGLFLDGEDKLLLTDEEPSKEELKVLHQTIKKVGEDIERLSFNTAVAQFMIFANEAAKLKCRKRAVLEPFLRTLAPFAPHIAEELWERAGHSESILNAPFPEYDESYLAEDAFEYPVSVNGKLRLKLELPLDLDKTQIEARALSAEGLKKHIEGKPIKKVIVVPGKIINVVV